MNKMICRMALALAVASLVGCGLKGPLYYPPAEQPKQQTSPDAKPTRADAQEQAPTTDPLQTQSVSPDSPQSDGVTQPATTEPDVQSAQ